MAIDLHAHWVPPALAAALRERSGAVPRIEPLPDAGERLVMPIGTLGFHPGYVEPGLRLAFMDRAGVQRQVLSLPGLFGIDSLPLAQAQPLVRADLRYTNGFALSWGEAPKAPPPAAIPTPLPAPIAVAGRLLQGIT